MAAVAQAESSTNVAPVITDEVVIRANNLTKAFSETVIALDKASFTVNKGEFVSLVGPSGCAKSTTLRMVAGLEDITDGLIKIGDRVVNDVRSKDRNRQRH